MFKFRRAETESERRRKIKQLLLVSSTRVFRRSQRTQGEVGDNGRSGSQKELS